MRALITGINGFAGQHLARHLAAQGDEVIGLIKPGSERLAGIQQFEADLRDFPAIERGMRVVEPAAIYHLAALSHVGASWEDRKATYEINVLGTVGVLEAARKLARRPRVLLVGSAEQYGRAAGDAPVDEDAPLAPLTPYGASKVAQEVIGRQAWMGDELPVIFARSFNHAGPGQEPSFVVPEWARAIAEMELGLRALRLEVGNLESRRDFSDVRDVVRAYRLMLVKGRPGEAYNACSGVARRVGDVLEALRALARVSFIVVPRAGSRPADVPVFVGSGEKAKRELLYEPAIPFEQTLRDVLEEWRTRLGPR